MDPIQPSKVPTGSSGLDAILSGGLPEGEVYLVQGGPGTGKTTLALQYLRTIAASGRTVLYMTLSQTRRSLTTIAHSHGWSLDGITIHEFKGAQAMAEAQSVFPSAEVELEETLTAFRDSLDEMRPDAVVIDTISDLRILASNATHYRRELLQLRRYLHDLGCTALLLDDRPHDGDRELQNQAHGIIMLEQQAPEYGDVRRRLQVLKMRGTPFVGGYHNFRIETGKLEVYPRVRAEARDGYASWETLASGVDALDGMLGGGLREGTACLVAGPTGSGKTTVSLQYAYAAAERGQTAAIFLFNERLETFYMRAEGVGMDVRAHIEAERLHVRQINTGTISASEFAQMVRTAVEECGAKVVVIDSLSGYLNAMLNRHLLVSQMHELITYLSQKGVLTLLVVDQHGALSSGDQTGPAHVSYLADSVLMLRYYEADGVRQRTISVLKQRHGTHEHGARRLTLTEAGVEIGSAVDDFVGLTLDPPLLATLYPQPPRDDQNGSSRLRAHA